MKVTEFQWDENDLIATTENGEVWRLKNPYPVSVTFTGLDCSSDVAEIMLEKAVSEPNES